MTNLICDELRHHNTVSLVTVADRSIKFTEGNRCRPSVKI